MAVICRASTSPNNCNHRNLTVDVDGSQFPFHTSDAELAAMSWDADAQKEFARLSLVRLNRQGVTCATMANRVMVGEEPTKLRLFPILTKDVGKTNMGGAANNAYVNVANGLNGERVAVNFTGFTQFRIRCLFSLIGAGTHNFRLVDQTLVTNVLYESPNQTGSGEKEVEPAWANLPAWATGDKYIVAQCKSSLNTDDPIYRGISLELR